MVLFMNEKRRVIAFTGGGTGGHVFPAFAVWESLKEADREGWLNYVWIGSRDGMEKQLVHARGIDYAEIPSGKFRRYFSLKNLTDIFRIAAGFICSLRILKKRKVSMLFSKGGFVSVPPVIAAHILGIPVISHESDLDPGLATRMNSRFSDLLCLAYEKTARAFSSKRNIVVTGNPVRKEILEGNRETGRRLYDIPEGKPLLLVLGGSLGALQVNELVAGSLDGLLYRFFVIHQMGEQLYHASNRKGYVTVPFLRAELPHLLAAADLVLCRSGAGTLWENGVTASPAILVPLGMGASRGDQLRNAEFFSEAKAALILKGKDGGEPDPSDLLEAAFSLIDDTAKLSSMAASASALCNKDAAETIARLLLSQLEKA